jgi:hypothetical protein
MKMCLGTANLLISDTLHADLSGVCIFGTCVYIAQQYRKRILLLPWQSLEYL